MEKDFNYYQQPFMDFNMANMSSGNLDMNEMYKDQIFNPIMQYEQAFSYYRYLCMQMDYKIKCKEYEKCVLLLLIMTEETTELISMLRLVF
ncbi:MAG: hypothetical protein ACLS90_05430 [Clostridia bacterium]